MVAPLDSRTTIAAGDETITLAMNFRTIALAEAEQVDVVTTMGADGSLSSPALLVWAFAQEVHPGLSKDQALAIVFHYGKAAAEALTAIYAKASVPPAKADADHPPIAGSEGA